MIFRGECDICDQEFQIDVGASSAAGYDLWVDDDAGTWGTWAPHRDGSTPACEEEYSRLTSDEPLATTKSRRA